MRKKLQNSEGYAESPEFLPALGVIYSRRSPSLQLEVNYIPSSLDYNFFCTLPYSLARPGNNQMR